MKFVYEDGLREYMERKGKKVIVVEVAASNHSDFEVTEIFLRFSSEKHAAYLIDKKRYRGYKTELGQVLLPPYRLEYEEVITFGLKKIAVFHSITQKGIRM